MTQRPAILAGLLLLTGCATPTGTGRSLWLTETWLRGDAAHQRERAVERRDAASDELVESAHGYVVAAGAALAADPDPGQPSQAAARLIGEARDSLDRARGILAPDVLDAREALGLALATEQGRRLDAAEATLERLRDQTARDAAAIARAQADVERLGGEAADWQRRYAESEVESRRWRFLAWGSAILFVALLIGFPALFLPLLSTARAAASAAGRGLAQTVAGIQRLKAERPDIRTDVARVLPMAQDEDVRAQVAAIKARLRP